jgi:Plasmid replication region DNA-binding N-term
VTEAAKPYGSPVRGVSQADVSLAADALLRVGERPTVERIRAAIGSGSPNTVGPLLDAWWKKLSNRLDAGPAALHRLPESVAHVAEALWMQALDEGRHRAQLELKSTQRAATEQQQSLEVRSHVLNLREGELDSRLRDRETTIADLNLQLRELTLLLRKEQATRQSLSRQIAELQSVRVKKQAPWRPRKSTTQKRRAKTPKRVTSKRPKARKRR